MKILLDIQLPGLFPNFTNVFFAPEKYLLFLWFKKFLFGFLSEAKKGKRYMTCKGVV